MLSRAPGQQLGVRSGAPDPETSKRQKTLDLAQIFKTDPSKHTSDEKELESKACAASPPADHIDKMEKIYV